MLTINPYFALRDELVHMENRRWTTYFANLGFVIKYDLGLALRYSNNTRLSHMDEL
jgi:hypothetical protein